MNSWAAVAVLENLTRHVKNEKERGKQIDDALVVAYEAMERYGEETGVTERQKAILRYIAFNPGVIIMGTERHVQDALKAGKRALETKINVISEAGREWKQ